jgi:putative tryptophan/tyrosine transport system substrate-binding protein
MKARPMDDPSLPNRSRRRVLRVVAAASLLATPFVRAQKGKVARVVIASAAPKRGVDAIRDHLAKAGFVEGRNLRIEQVVIGGAPPELAEPRAREVIASRPDLIFMSFAPETVLLHHLTREIPIVFFDCQFDPVRGGLIASAARPGANLTGTYHDYLPLIVKRWALFKEVLPSLRHGAWVGHLEPPRWKHRAAAAAYAKGFLDQEREATARAQRELGIRITEIVIPRDATEEQVVTAIRSVRPEAVRLSTGNDFKEDGPVDKLLLSDRILSELVVRAGMGSLEGWHEALRMMVQILRGSRPADMPAFEGTQYTVKANPTLAKRMGITLPPSILLQAGLIEGERE